MRLNHKETRTGIRRQATIERRAAKFDSGGTRARTCNITLDWIYRGQMHSLQPDICAKIETELDRLP
jgi:hypothetical protein